jgi:hypothetical protein
MKPAICATLVFWIALGVSFAQEAKKIPIEVSHRGDDYVGRAIVFSLKEAIRGAKGFQLVDSDFRQPRIVVYLRTRDMSHGQSRLFSLATVAVVYENLAIPPVGIFITLDGQICAQGEGDTCARVLLPAIDGAIEQLRKHWPEYWKTL